MVAVTKMKPSSTISRLTFLTLYMFLLMILEVKQESDSIFLPSFNIYMSWMTSLVAQTVKHLPTVWETQVQSLGWKIRWRRKWQPIPVPLPGKIPWTEEPGGLHTVHGVAKSWIRLSDFRRNKSNHEEPSCHISLKVSHTEVYSEKI